MLDEMILNSSERLQELKKDGTLSKDYARAFISGTFTNWEPRRMLQIDQLCAYLEGKSDVLQK
jgi:hypothetical protein